MKKLVRAELPVGIEAAAERFAAACVRDGHGGMVDLIASAGKPDLMNIEGRVYMYQDGDWYVHEEV